MCDVERAKPDLSARPMQRSLAVFFRDYKQNEIIKTKKVSDSIDENPLNAFSSQNKVAKMAPGSATNRPDSRPNFWVHHK